MQDTATPRTYQHGGHTIAVAFEHNKVQFQITGPLQAGAKYPATADSFDAAKQQIDNFLTEKAQAERAANTAKIKVPVLNDKGEPETVTGINMRNGTLTFAEEHEYKQGSGWRSHDYVYPNFPHVAEMLKRQIIVDAEATALREKLHRLRIEVSRTMGKPEMKHLPGIINKVAKDLAEAVAEAEAIKPEGA